MLLCMPLGTNIFSETEIPVAYLSQSKVGLDVLRVQLEGIVGLGDGWLRLALPQVAEGEVKAELQQQSLPLTLLFLIL